MRKKKIMSYVTKINKKNTLFNENYNKISYVSEKILNNYFLKKSRNK